MNTRHNYKEETGKSVVLCGWCNLVLVLEKFSFILSSLADDSEFKFNVNRRLEKRCQKAIALIQAWVDCENYMRPIKHTVSSQP